MSHYTPDAIDRLREEIVCAMPLGKTPIEKRQDRIDETARALFVSIAVQDVPHQGRLTRMAVPCAETAAEAYDAAEALELERRKRVKA